jgi:hypothetical protein
MTKYEVWVEAKAIYKIDVEADSHAAAELIAKEEAGRYVKSGYLVSYDVDVVPVHEV